MQIFYIILLVILFACLVLVTEDISDIDRGHCWEDYK